MATKKEESRTKRMQAKGYSRYHTPWLPEEITEKIKQYTEQLKKKMENEK